MYKADCSCESCYIGEIKHNVEVRWNKHNNPTKSSESTKTHQNNSGHYFIWSIISNAPKNSKTTKNLEESHIALVLLRNGVTQSN